jgi:hypothetical protein
MIDGRWEARTNLHLSMPPGWAIRLPSSPGRRESIFVHAVSASAEALRILDITSQGKLQRMASRPSAFPLPKGLEGC